MKKKPELLAPAGDMERLQMAVLYGADAVYLAGTDFGMRAFAGNFAPDELRQAVDYAHRHGVRVHCTINTMPRNDEIVRLPEHLERLNDAGVDAVIVADMDTTVASQSLAAPVTPRITKVITITAITLDAIRSFISLRSLCRAATLSRAEALFIALWFTMFSQPS